MRWFETSTEAERVVPVAPGEVWEVLRDPALVAGLTPMVHQITARGELWHWELARLPVLGVAVTPAFTERMQFEEQRRIEFTHAPPEGAAEHSGVDGSYELADVPGGTHLAIGLTVKVQLPLPRLSGPAVRTTMRAVIGSMGHGFARNLMRHLDAQT